MEEEITGTELLFVFCWWKECNGMREGDIEVMRN